MVITAVLLLLAISSSHSATLNAKGGPWSNPSSWVEGRVPGDRDSVTIGNGTTITLDTQTSNIVVLSIESGGSLIFSNGKGESDTELAITVETFFVAGLLQMGTSQEPLARPARIMLVNYDTPVSRALDGTVFSLLQEPYGKKVLLVYDHGKWLANAKGRTPTWTRLSSSTSKGDTTLNLADKVDWKVGDEIFITSTDYNADQTERHFVKSISADGKSLTLSAPLKFGHFGQVLEYQGFPVDMRAEVGVLTSNVKIYGDMATSANWTSVQEPEYIGFDQFMQFGGHTAFIHNATAQIEGLEFYHMGQGGRLGRYPVHWHMMIEAPGQYIKRSSLHDMFMRCISIHTTNNVTMQDTICLDTYGHSVYQEEGLEYGNSFIRNLVVKSRPITNGQGSMDMATGSNKWAQCAAHPPGLRLQYVDYMPSGFWITNTNATMIGNVAVGHPFGFWIRVEPMFAEPDFLNIGCTVCPPGCKFPGHAHPTNTFSSMVFDGNVAHSNEVGWWVKENWTPSDGVNLQVLNHFTLYKNGVGVMNYGISNMIFNHIISADNAVGFNADWVRGGKIIVKNSIFVKETTNYGNVDDQHPSGIYVIPANCSAIYPEKPRTWSIPRSEHHGNLVGLNLGDTEFAMENIYFVNWKQNCREDGLGYFSYCGAIQFPVKFSGDLLNPSLRYMDRIWYVNSDGGFHNSYSKNTTCDHRGLNTNALIGAINYQSGLLDKAGSLPCSEPGSYWMFPNNNVTSDDCVYQPDQEMEKCPNVVGGVDHIYMGAYRVWSGASWDIPKNVSVNWECGKSFPPTSSLMLRADKEYVIDVKQLPSHGGISLRPRVRDFKGRWVTFKYYGQYSVEVYPFCSWPPKYGFNNQPSFAQSECHCNETWTKVWIPAATNRSLGENGQCEIQFVANYNASIPCDNKCGNPWPIPAPKGYTCGVRKSAPAGQVCKVKTAPKYDGFGLGGSTSTRGEEEVTQLGESAAVGLLVSVLLPALLALFM